MILQKLTDIDSKMDDIEGKIDDMDKRWDERMKKTENDLNGNGKPGIKQKIAKFEGAAAVLGFLAGSSFVGTGVALIKIFWGV